MATLAQTTARKGKWNTNSSFRKIIFIVISSHVIVYNYRWSFIHGSEKPRNEKRKLARRQNSTLYKSELDLLEHKSHNIGHYDWNVKKSLDNNQTRSDALVKENRTSQNWNQTRSDTPLKENRFLSNLNRTRSGTLRKENRVCLKNSSNNIAYSERGEPINSIYSWRFNTNSKVISTDQITSNSANRLSRLQAPELYGTYMFSCWIHVYQIFYWP